MDQWDVKSKDCFSTVLCKTSNSWTEYVAQIFPLLWTYALGKTDNFFDWQETLQVFDADWMLRQIYIFDWFIFMVRHQLTYSAHAHSKKLHFVQHGKHFLVHHFHFSKHCFLLLLLFHHFYELLDLICHQMGLLHCSKMAPTSHGSKSHQVVIFLFGP